MTEPAARNSATSLVPVTDGSACARNTEVHPDLQTQTEQAQPPEPFLQAVDAALAQRDFRLARTQLAEAETNAALPQWAARLAKARIAQADGDLEAAAAILVMAIEAAPGVAALRRLMTEVLLAKGRAGHARDVLHHLGRAPSNPPRDDSPPLSAPRQGLV